jgi:hypothetical protein
VIAQTTSSTSVFNSSQVSGDAVGTATMIRSGWSCRSATTALGEVDLVPFGANHFTGPCCSQDREFESARRDALLLT